MVAVPDVDGTYSVPEVLAKQSIISLIAKHTGLQVQQLILLLG